MAGPGAGVAGGGGGVTGAQDVSHHLSAMAFFKGFLRDTGEDPEAMKRGRVQLTRTMAGSYVVLACIFYLTTPAPFFSGPYKVLPSLLVCLWGALTDLEVPAKRLAFGYLFCTFTLLLPLLLNVDAMSHGRAIDVTSSTGADLVPLFAGFIIDRSAALLFTLANIVQTCVMLSWTINSGTVPEGTVMGMDGREFAVNQAILIILRSVLLGLCGSAFHFWVKTILTELADTANTRRRVISNLNHEIRTPLSGMLGLLEQLMDVTDDPAKRELLGSIQVSGEALLLLLRNILDIARLDARAVSLFPQDFVLHDVCRDVLNLFRAYAAVKHQDLRLIIGEQVHANVHGDAFRLYQVLCNLVGNAIKFTPVHGSIQIIVMPAVPDEFTEGPGADRIRFAVVDSGAGIPASLQARLFQPFQQADMASTRQHGGSGLGLTICKELVALMGGELRYTDREQSPGAVFSFAVPLPRATSDPPLRRRSATPEYRVRPLRRFQSDDAVYSRSSRPTTPSTVRRRAVGGADATGAAAATGGAGGASQLEEVGPDSHTASPLPRPLRTPGQSTGTSPVIGGAAYIGSWALHTPVLRAAALLSGATGVATETTAAALDLANEPAGAAGNSPLRQRTLARRRSIGGGSPGHAGDAASGSNSSGGNTGHAASGSMDAGSSPPLPLVLPDGRQPCVLVVEDNATNVRVLCRQLQGLGVKAHVAGNGRVALEMLQEPPASTDAHFDLVLMDLNMPVMDGYQATAAIRALEAQRGRILRSRQTVLPIIAITANDEAESDRALAAGMTEFLTKPLTRADLREMLHRHLAVRKDAAPSAPHED